MSRIRDSCAATFFLIIVLERFPVSQIRDSGSHVAPTFNLSTNRRICDVDSDQGAFCRGIQDSKQIRARNLLERSAESPYQM